MFSGSELSPVVTSTGIPTAILDISSSSMLASTTREEVSETVMTGVPEAVSLSPTLTTTEEIMPSISERISVFCISFSSSFTRLTAAS